MTPVFFESKEHRYFLDEACTQEVPSVSRLLEHFGYANFNRVDPAVLKAAQEYGKVVHETLALLDQGKLESFDPSIAGEVSSWSRFIDEQPEPPNFLLIEKPLVSRWGFAGTPDRFCIQTQTIYDIKTGSNSISHAMQTAFYKILIEENYPDYKVKRRMTVNLGKYKYTLTPHKDAGNEVVAKAMLTVYKDQLRKGVINGHVKSE